MLMVRTVLPHAMLSPMTGRLDGKVTLITGAAAGLGRVAAELFAVEGGRVVIADVTDGADAVDAIAAAGGEAAYVATDVRDDASVAAAVAFAVETFGGLHVLYNNAGVSPADDDGPTNTSDETWATTLDINVTGVARCCRHGIPAMLDSGGGSIINVASFVAHLGAATPQIAYTASKGAVVAMTRELAVIHARENIRVNALSPGPLKTELLMSFLNTEEKKKRRLVHLPMGRFGEAHEIAQAALWLASDESSYVTGTEFLVDGGLTAAYVT